MTRVLSMFLDDFAIPTLGTRTIVSHAFLGNEASRRVHLKLGFVETGQATIRMPEYRGGELRDEWVFEWSWPESQERARQQA